MEETSGPHRPVPARGSRVPVGMLVGLALFALALSHFTAAIGSTPFHRDEARWIFHAGALRNLGDPLGPAWADSEQNRDQPPVTGYLLGLGLVAQGRALGTIGWWNMSQGDAWNIANGNAPRSADIVAGRRFDSLLGACTIVVIFLIVARLTNVVGGVVAALGLTFHPLMTYLSSLVDSDITLALLLALATLAAMSLAANPNWPQAVILAMLLGLGGAAKLSPLGVTVALAGLGIMLLARHWWRRDAWGAQERRLGVMLLAQPVIAAATFVAVSPYLWRDPLGNTRNLFAFRATEIDNQRQIWPHLQVDGPAQALGHIWEQLGTQATTSGWVSNQLAPFTHGTWRPDGLDLVFGLAGLALLAAMAWRGGPASPAALAVTVLGATALITIAAMRVYFPRYLLPIAISIAIGAGILAGAALPVIISAGNGIMRAAGQRLGPTRASPRLPETG
jgi:hypothetical protein